jgi:hypothetical protein
MLETYLIYPLQSTTLVCKGKDGNLLSEKKETLEIGNNTLKNY